MIQISNLTKAFGERILLDEVTTTINRGERVGLIGRNGSGKSTLFSMILGETSPDSGEIIVPKHYRCGHLRQHLSFDQENIVKEACQGLPVDQRDEEYRAEIILSGLGFSEAAMQLPAQHFSGGFQIRVELARVLLSEPNLLLLDEPTNYLDIVSVRWLTRFLNDWSNELILISHDREFMDSVTTHTMYVHRSKIKKIKGNTTKMYEQVAQDETVHEQTRQNIEKKKKEIEQFVTRFRAQASKATLVQSKIKAMERLGNLDELQDAANLDFEFNESPFHGRFLAEAQNLTFAYQKRDSAELNPPLIKEFSIAIAPGDRIGIIGKNGKGKSTLLRLLAQDLSPLSGELKLNPNTKTGYFGQTNIQRLSPNLTVEDEIISANSKLSRTVIRTICGTMMFSGDDALKKIKILSGGERSRVLLGKILAQPTNLLLLDEPTNHLDMESIEALLETLQNYQGAVVIVTHSELILHKLATKLIIFQDEGPEVLNGNYDYFLEKIGWVDEDEITGRKRKPKNTDKRERAELIQERSKVLSPLKQKVDSLEKEIYKREELIKCYHDELIQASAQNKGERIAELGKLENLAKKEIDQLFEELSATSKELEVQTNKYNELADDID